MITAIAKRIRTAIADYWTEPDDGINVAHGNRMAAYLNRQCSVRCLVNQRKAAQVHDGQNCTVVQVPVMYRTYAQIGALITARDGYASSVHPVGVIADYDPGNRPNVTLTFAFGNSADAMLFKLANGGTI